MCLSFIEHYNQSGDRDARGLHSIEDYGECEVAAAANGVPTAEQLEECPFYAFIEANRSRL